MNDHTPQGEHDSTPVPLNQGHVQGTGGIPERFENPGLPPHVHRASDTDEQAAKRAERTIAGLFGLSMLGTVLFLVAYFMVDVDEMTFVPGIGDMSLSNLLLGLGLALALLGIGLGAVQWAKTLMPDEEVVEMRHPMRSSDEAREGFVQTILDGGESSQLTRRPLIKATLGGALGLFSLPLLVQLAGSLGPLPRNDLSVTFWNGEKGEDGTWTAMQRRLHLDPEDRPIKASDVTIGSVFHVLPEGLQSELHGAEKLNEITKASVLVMRLNPDEFQDTPQGRKARDWGYQGIVAYSKVCTHVGCPVGLYEQTTHHLLCPCHQSTFDVTNDCEVIFGPAGRPLPQLKIGVDAQGYLIAEQSFQEPVGPSFWERES
ncbi:Rieske 2Fe-2S domain-containing protein [Marihabitans asiaticum]|uniref:Cytochrome bc1 complex Rieske iron-sulfur subunit n=1 Tax=Marihabitans asiaticum TaxID=415218 RepID=A0A560W701_9MICO|nr:Rieske 2Fe-2S domain-containing protein [Marihabitans asiaticum]TWD13389.1 menaquinol-cytochrome c reductase iron-sulfur subunit precursor [Marihabitans asiaticum]